jgi:aminoglycoside phosphotransferase family enzyme
VSSRRSGTAAAGAPEKLAFLADPRHYPGRPGSVTVIETHFAWVFLTPRHAWKLKKALRQDSMDYRTVARRGRGCRTELQLNRRLAPGVYLAVVPLARTRSGELALGKRGTVVDWLVRMRRLPAARLLDRALADGAVRPADLAAVTTALTAFFRHARRAPLGGKAYLDRLRARTRQNGRALRAPRMGLDGRRVDTAVRLQLEFIARSPALLAARARRLIDGHGDLRPEHVCLGPPACVIDCLEFNRDLRRLDPAEEMAFLALECARLGHGATGAELLARYRAGMPDGVPPALMDFYMSQRALTRAKIAAWHLRDPRFDARHWRARANSYVGDAIRHARAALREITRDAPASVLRGDRPVPQQRGKGSAGNHPPQGLAQQRRDRQRHEPASRRG